MHLDGSIFFWLLDTSIVNTFLIPKTFNLVMIHKDLRINLVSSLVEKFIENELKITYMKKVTIQSELQNLETKSFMLQKNLAHIA